MILKHHFFNFIFRIVINKIYLNILKMKNDTIITNSKINAKNKKKFLLNFFRKLKIKYQIMIY